MAEVKVEIAQSAIDEAAKKEITSLKKKVTLLEKKNADLKRANDSYKWQEKKHQDFVNFTREFVEEALDRGFVLIRGQGKYD